MLDDIIKLLQAAPVLTLSLPAKKEFLLRSNILNTNLSAATFKENCEQYPDTVFTRAEKRQIYEYLAIWPDLIKELRYFLKIAHLVWKEVHRDLMGGDDILPLLIALMPRDLALLNHLTNKLLFAAAVDQSSDSTYYLTVLAIATEHLIKELTPVPPPVEDDPHQKPGLMHSVPVLGRIDHAINLSGFFSIFSKSSQSMPDMTTAPHPLKLREPDIKQEKCEMIALKLQKPIICATVYLIMKLSELFHRYQDTCTLKIYNLLHINNVHAYDISPDIENAEAWAFALNESMKKLLMDLPLQALLADTPLLKLTNEHIAYQDFLTTLTRVKKHPFSRLVELTNKFDIHRHILPVELWDEKIEMTQRIREFLGFSPAKRRSFATIQASSLTEVTFTEFMSHVADTIEQLDDKRQKQEKNEFVIPEPEQLAVLLRRSL